MHGIGAGDEVLVPSYGGGEVAAAVRSIGATAVFVDIEPDSLCLDPAAAADAVTERTAAIVPVHLFGHPADMARLRELARRQGLLLLDHSPEPAPDALAAARRRGNADYLGARLKGVITPSPTPGLRHTYEQYVVRVPGNGRPDRDAFARALRSRGVSCRIPVQTPTHRMPGFPTRVWLPETERATDECLALPAGPEMTRRDLQRVVSACNALGGLVREPVP